MSEQGRFEYRSSDLDFEYLLRLDFPKLEKNKSVIHGEGIFTSQPINDKSVICPLFGILYNLNDTKLHYPKHSYQITDNIAIETKNEPGFFNHSCIPNTFINDSWTFEALKDIQQGEEISIDYGTVDYFNYSFPCSCKSASCRRIFSGRVSAEPTYQEVMGRYFSPYLKEKFHWLASTETHAKIVENLDI